MNPGSEEIRINEMFASRLKATYVGDKDTESVPNVRCDNVRTELFLDKLKGAIEPQFSQDLMPPNCRFLKTYKNGTIVVIEEPPAMRSIRVRMDMSRDSESLKSKNQWEAFGYKDWFKENQSPYVFMLAMPYVIHVLLINNDKKFSRGKIFFRTQPLLGPADLLFLPPLLNVSSDMSVCYGDDAHRGPIGVTRAVEDVIRVFWSAQFNTDYIDNYNKYSEVAGLCDYFTWQYYTQTNPMFIYTADWIPYKRPFDEIIKRMESANKLNAENIFGYKTLRDLFHKSEESNKTVKVGLLELERTLIYDITSVWFPTPDTQIQLGDPLNYSKGRIAYIDCFMGVVGQSEPMFIRLIVDGKLISMKLNEAVGAFIAEKVKELRYETSIELPDGTILTAGDIISTKNRFDNEVYKKLYYIRKAADDRIEVRLGSEFWFVDVFDWDKIKKIDISHPELSGLKIKKDTTYIYYTSNYSPPSAIARTIDVKFNEVTTGRNNELVAKFIEVNGDNRDYSINLTDNSSRRTRAIYPADDLEKMPEAFFIGRMIQTVTDEHGDRKITNRHPDLGIIIPTNYRIRNKVSSSTIENCFLKDDGQRFHSESNNLIVDFSIGDKVIVANWQNPLDVLKIKAIQSFVVDASERTVDFMLVDKHGNLSQQRYLDGTRGYIKTGKIRKVTNELNGITIGTKIISKEARISCFPKNAVNIIVAFVIDTGGEPLVLCSNGCTLWFSDMVEKFEHIPMKSKRWKKLIHTPLDPTKIKLQPGDIVNGTIYHQTDYGYMMVKSRQSTSFRPVNLGYYHEYDEYAHMDSMFRSEVLLDCIPNPRMTIPQQREKGYVNAFPTFHGGYTEASNNSPYQLIDETGRF